MTMPDPDPLDRLLENGPIAEFYGLWRDACGPGGLPPRREISLSRFRRFVAEMAIYDLAADGAITFHLVGDTMKKRVGDPKGDRDIMDYVDPALRPRARAWWRSLFDTPCGSVFRFDTDYQSGLSRLMDSILLPIRGDRDGTVMLLGLNRIEAPLGLGAGSPEAPGDMPLRIGTRHVAARYLDTGAGLPPGDTAISLGTPPE